MATRIVNSAAAAVAASGTITIVDYTTIPGFGFTVYVGAQQFIEGIGWNAATSNNATATSLASAINGADPSYTAVANNAVVTITAATAGTAGNSIRFSLDVTQGLIQVTHDPDTHTNVAGVDEGFLAGGAAAVVTNGLISSAPIRMKSLVVESTGSALGVHVLNGATSAGTEYDLVTGTTTRAVVRNYNKGLALPAGCYLTLDADVTQVVAQFDYI